LTSDVLGYPKGLIGRRMSPEVSGLDPDATAAGALADVRRVLEHAETINTLPVTDPRRLLLGVVSLRDLMKAAPEQTVAEIMRPADFVRAADDAEGAARLCASAKHLALPVVDSDRRLVGRCRCWPRWFARIRRCSPIRSSRPLSTQRVW
jgi:magnesium transporter